MRGKGNVKGQRGEGGNKKEERAMDKLVKESAEIPKAVQKNAKDETLKKLITQAHDTFHVIQGLCKEE